MTDKPTDFTPLTVQLVSAFVAQNTIRPNEVTALIQATHKALTDLSAAPVETDEAPATDYSPAVSVRKSLASEDHIISMIDGKPYRSLKRHLTSKGLTFEEYKTRYKLPASYPSVAPSYSASRREIAKRLGLGRKPKAAIVEVTPDKQSAAPTPKRRGRPPKVATA